MQNFKAAKIEVYVPAEALEAVKNAMHKAGAGRLGDYDCAAAEIKVKGYWRPLAGARPYLGSLNEICSADEIKIEAYCAREYIRDVLQAIRTSHPYEEPVINVIPLVNHLFEALI
ncbi:MAG: cytochrome C biogenesis protein [Candidatus Rifleibacteriota bacterium]